MYKHEKVQITNDAGQNVEALAPVIISASRSTDIPAFYAEWFFNRLKRGYCVWYNPFNNKKFYISFKNCRVIVFWTKNPKPILPLLPLLDERGINYYFQFTLNDYEAERLEPNVPSLTERINIFRSLVSLLGPERVIWRFDPLILSPGMTQDALLKKIRNIGDNLRGYTKKLVFSFVDIAAYKKVQNNLIREIKWINKDNIYTLEMDYAKKMDIIAATVKLRDSWRKDGWDLTLASCCENIDLNDYGIYANRCIDGELISELFSHDKKLINWLKTGYPPAQPARRQLLNDGYASCSIDFGKIRDKGQRKECGCILSKDIGSYNTCRHFCVYCYANTSRKHVMSNAWVHDPTNESIS